MISFLLHLLIWLLFTTNFKEITYLPSKKQEKKISLNLNQIVTPKPIPKPKPKPVPIPQPKPIVKPPTPPQPVVEKVTPPTPKPETVKRKSVDESKKTFAVKSMEDNNITKVEQKPEKKKKIVKKEVKKEPKKKVVKKRVVQKPKPKRYKDPLANALMGSGTSMLPQTSSPSRAASRAYNSQVIKRLYGPEFETFSQTQKKFIKNNLSTIHRITQQTLTINGYPEIAARTGQQGTNVVSFYLHPNGDISQLRLKRDIGYQALDQNTLDVIRIAYKDYPLPNKKTKIIFYVQYTLY